MFDLLLAPVAAVADIAAAELPVQQMLTTSHSDRAAHALGLIGVLIIAYIGLWAVGGVIAGLWPLFHRTPPGPPKE